MTKVNERTQKIVAAILTEFMFAENMDEVRTVWNHIYNKYELCDDPFTHTPCSPKEYCKNQLEYDKQTMIDKYGHCDGLE